MPKESNFTKGRNPLCKNDYLWESRDEQSAEQEVSDFVYSLVRLIKPKFVLETGCYLGDTTYAIALALKDNKYGELRACDTFQGRVDIVNKRLKDNGLPGKVLKIKGVDLIKQYKDRVDFAFIDSGDENEREEEIGYLIPLLKRLNMFLMHDTAPQHSGYNMVADMVDLPKIYFNTPRGLTLFLKNY